MFARKTEQHEHHEINGYDDDEIEYDYFDMDDFKSFENDKFTLFTFKNECDYTYKIQFDIIHCDSNLNIIDDFKMLKKSAAGMKRSLPSTLTVLAIWNIFCSLGWTTKNYPSQSLML